MIRVADIRWHHATYFMCAAFIGMYLPWVVTIGLGLSLGASLPKEAWISIADPIGTLACRALAVIVPAIFAVRTFLKGGPENITKVTIWAGLSFGSLLMGLFLTITPER